MKAHFITLLAVALAPAAFAEEYSAFRISRDQHMVRTSDGAEAGRVEYLIVDPASHRVMSTVITGGVVGNKLVAVPFETVEVGGSGVITLTAIDRAKLAAAPELEKSQFATSSVDSSILDRMTKHFGIRPKAETPGVEGTAKSGEESTSRVTSGAPAPRTPGEKDLPQVGERLPITPGRTTTTPESPNTDPRVPAQPGKTGPKNGNQDREPVGEKFPEKKGNGLNRL